MGVVFGFLGSFSDNCYWFIPWSLDFIRHPETEWWIRAGPALNIIHRQIAGIAAGYCHVRAAVEFTEGRHNLSDLTRTTLCATGIGVIYVVYLNALR